MSTSLLLTALAPLVRVRHYGPLLLALLLLSAWRVQAQPTVTSLSPARNAKTAPRTTNVVLTYNQALNAATAANLRVFSAQRGGQLVRGGNATATSSNTLTVNPAQDFRPGETVFVTSPATVRSSSGTASRPYVYQFTIAPSQASTGTFGQGSDVNVNGQGYNPFDVVTGDIDGDGDLDLLTANFDGVGSVSIRFNQGNGTFSGSGEMGVGTGASNLVLGDIDGDGDLDVLTDSRRGATVSVHLNQGNGTFIDGSDVGVDGTTMALGDVDGDGDLDLLTPTGYTTVSVRLNQGNGTFSGGSDVTVGGGVQGVAVGDVDGDGDLDLLAAASDIDKVSVRLNQGNGTFSGGSDVPVGDYPKSVAVGDVDGDGDLDLLAATNRNLVSVRLNQGNGTFGGGSNVTVGDYPASATVGDVDGDGDLDLLAANDNLVSVRLNQGNGTFGGGSDVPVAGYPKTVVVGDVNGDGNLDFITADYNSTASVRLNLPFAPTLTSLSSTSGPVGTSITLTGTNLSGATAVGFNGAAATFSVVSNTTITATVPAGATTGPVTVTTLGGTSNGIAFTVLAPGNNDCAGATLLTVAATCTPTAGTTGAATQSLPAITCGSYTGAADDDVWYRFTASAATQTVTVIGSSNLDAVVDVRAGSCASSTNIGCADATVEGGTETVTLSSLTPGSTYYVRVYSFGSAGTDRGDFTICVTSPITTSPTVTAPASNSTTNGLPTFTGTAPAGSTVTIYLAAGSGAAQAIGTTTATGSSFSFTPTTALASGSYSVYATAQSSIQTVSAQSNTNTFTVDATRPTVTSSNRQSPAAVITNASALTFRVTFSEAVTGVDVTDFTLTTTAGTVSSSSRTVMAVSGSVYDVTASGVSGNGTLRLDVKSTGSGISDAVGNPLSGGYTGGQLYTLDQTAPTVTSLTSANGASGTTTSTTPLAFTVTFSEAVTGFSAGDITVGNGTVSSGPTASGSTSFNFSVTPTTAGSATTVTIAAGAAQDAAGNPSAASASYTLTFVPPVVTPSPASLPNGVVGTAYSQVLTATGGTAPYTFAVTSGTLPAGLTLTNGTLAGTPTAGGPFSFTVTATDAAPAPGPFRGARPYSITIEYPDLIISSSGQSVPAGTYHDITVLNGGAGTLAGNITVNGSVTVQSGGSLNDGCFVLRGPGSFTLAAGGTLGICAAQGISSSGSTGAVQVTGTRTFNADALYTYSGSAAQVTGSGLPATVRTLTLSNSAGLTLTDDVTATRTVTLTAGVLRTGSNALTLGSTATLSEDADGYATGTVQTTRTLSTAGTAQAFGGLGLTLTPSGSRLPGSTLVVRTTGTARTGAGTSQSVKRVFDIQPTVRTGLDVALALTVRDDERNNIPAANLRLFKSDNAGSTWQPQKAATFVITAASGSQPISYTASLSGISNFSLWTLGNAANPLPVELAAFTAQAQGSGALLRWTTASEANNAGFEVESSADGATFVRLGTVAGAGSSTQPHSYTFIDEHVARYAAPRVYYRLRQVDLDGTASYSPVRTVAVTGSAGLALFPNPTTQAATLTGAAPGTVVTVVDALGRPVLTATADASGTAALPLPRGLATGVYVVHAGRQALRLAVE